MTQIQMMKISIILIIQSFKWDNTKKKTWTHHFIHMFDSEIKFNWFDFYITIKIKYAFHHLIFFPKFPILIFFPGFLILIFFPGFSSLIFLAGFSMRISYPGFLIWIFFPGFSIWIFFPGFLMWISYPGFLKR